jgi:outer membrane protein
MIQKGTLLALAFVWGTVTQAQKVNSFSVKQAVDYGIANATAVKNALIDIQIQKQTNREFTANAFPQISAGGDLKDFVNIPVSLIPAQFFGGPAGATVPVQFGVKYNATGSVDIQQLLFDGQVFVGLQARDAALQLATKTKEVTEEQIKSNIYKIYYQIVVGRKQATAIDANIERFQKLLSDVKAIFKQGFNEKLDIDKTQVQLNNLETEKYKINYTLDAAVAGLKFLMNMPQKDSLVLTDTLSEESLKSNILEEKYNYADRKEMQLLDIASRLNKYNLKRYNLSRIPTIAAFGSYQKNAQRNKFDFFNDGSWFTTTVIGVSVRVPIFDGFARRAKIEKAKYEIRKTENTVEQFKQSVDYEVNAANLKMKAAILTIDNQKRNVELAEKVFNTTKKKYEAGLGSNQEIYFAQTDLKVAQTNYYAALYDAIQAKIDYLKATGKL